MKQKKTNTPRVVLVLIFLITVILSGLAVYFGIRLQSENQVSPTNTSAILNEGLLGEAHPGTSYPLCSSEFFVENLAENYNSSTGEYTLTGNYNNRGSSAVSGDAAVFLCRCREGDGNNELGHCNGNWPLNNGPDYSDPDLTPLRAAQTCERLDNIDLNLSPGSTRNFNIVAQQASPDACGSFQIDIISVRPDGEGEDPGAELNLPGEFSCQSADWYHVAAVYRTGTDCSPRCDSLTTSTGETSITLERGQEASVTLDPTTFDFGIASSQYTLTNGFGNISGNTWSITGSQSNQLEAGSTGTIQVLLDGVAQSACQIPITVTSGEASPSLSCDNLSISSGQTSIDSAGETISLQTGITAENVTSSITYTYGTSIGTITGNGTDATWEIPSIPSGTTEISAWVAVDVGGISAGCSDENCTQSCIATLQVTSPSCGDGTCDSGESCEINGGNEFSCNNGEQGDALTSGSCRTASCTYCGDDIVNGSEACEPGDSNSQTGQTCSTTCEWSAIAQCGTACSDSTQCPSEMTCSGGLCRNPSCTGETDCICAVSQCGSACIIDADCPNGMSCTSDNLCRRSACSNAVDCICTGIIEDSFEGQIITGILLILAGVLIIRTLQLGHFPVQFRFHKNEEEKANDMPIFKEIKRKRESQKKRFERNFNN